MYNEPAQLNLLDQTRWRAHLYKKMLQCDFTFYHGKNIQYINLRYYFCGSVSILLTVFWGLVGFLLTVLGFNEYLTDCFGVHLVFY